MTEHDDLQPDPGVGDPGDPAGPPRRRLPPLSLKVRIVVLVVSWLLILIGIAGLALPGLQGILTILLGMAGLSVASETVHRWLHRLLHRWPGLWEKISHFRHRLHDRLTRHHEPHDD